MDRTLHHLWPNLIHTLPSRSGPAINGLTSFKSKGIVFQNQHPLTLKHRRYYIDPSSVVVIGRPSAALAAKLEKDEKKRLAAQVKRLGPEGIKAAAKELEEAKAEHDKPIPTEVLTRFQIPSVKSISWIPVQSVQQKGKGRSAPPTASSSDLAKIIASDGDELPFFVQYDHVEVDTFS